MQMQRVLGLPVVVVAVTLMEVLMLIIEGLLEVLSKENKGSLYLINAEECISRVASFIHLDILTYFLLIEKMNCI